MIYYHCKACGMDVTDADVTNYNAGGHWTHLRCGGVAEVRDTNDLVRKQTSTQRRSRVSHREGGICDGR